MQRTLQRFKFPYLSQKRAERPKFLRIGSQHQRRPQSHIPRLPIQRNFKMSSRSAIQNILRRAAEAGSKFSVGQTTRQLSADLLKDFNNLLKSTPSAVMSIAKSSVVTGLLGFGAGSLLLLEYHVLGSGIGSTYLSLLTLGFPVAFGTIGAWAGAYSGMWNAVYRVMVGSGFVTSLAKDLAHGVTEVYKVASGRETPIVPVESLIATVDSYLNGYTAWAADKPFFIRWGMGRTTSLLRSFVLGLIPDTKDVAVDEFVSNLVGKQLDNFFYAVTAGHGSKPKQVMWGLWAVSAAVLGGWTLFM